MSLGPSEGGSASWLPLLAVGLFSSISYVLGATTMAESFLRGGAIAVAIYAWAIGLHQYVFSMLFEPDSQFITHAKSGLIRFISSLTYLALFLGIFFFNESTLFHKDQYMVTLSLLSLTWAFLLYRRIRLIEDTAHSSLNSAAQGYSVLEGKVSLYEGEVARGPHLELPVMVWYSKYLYTSSAGFLLNDGKGICTVDPRDAEVITPRYHYGSSSYNAIYPAETIYVIGQLETLSKQRNEYERKGLISSKIIEWKRNSAKLLDYFDKNNDGKIDDQEMSLIRYSATRAVDDDLEESYQLPASHVISRPADSRPFIISSIHPDELILRYKRAMYFHLVAWSLLTLFTLILQTY